MGGWRAGRIMVCEKKTLGGEADNVSTTTINYQNCVKDIHHKI